MAVVDTVVTILPRGKLDLRRGSEKAEAGFTHNPSIIKLMQEKRTSPPSYPNPFPIRYRERA
jgi:hypothetical protein